MKSLKLVHPTTGFGIGLSLTLLLSGCSGYNGSGYGLGSAPAGAVTSIDVTPSSDEMTAGTTAKLTAIGHYGNGTTADISTSVSWSSAAPGTASVASPGVVTGNAVGTATITASVNNGTAYGVTSGTGAIAVTAATLNNISVAPPTMSIAPGAMTTFTATGTFSDSTTGNVSGSVAWSSSNTAVATVDGSGIATGVGAGSCTITASANGISNIATLTVF